MHWVSWGTAVHGPVDGISVEEVISSETGLVSVFISSDLAEVVNSADFEMDGSDGFLPSWHGGAGWSH